MQESSFLKTRYEIHNIFLYIQIHIRGTVTYPNMRVQICNKILDINDKLRPNLSSKL